MALGSTRELHAPSPPSAAHALLPIETAVILVNSLTNTSSTLQQITLIHHHLLPYVHLLDTCTSLLNNSLQWG